MCLAVPLQIAEILDGRMAVVSQGNFTLTVDISMVQDAVPGDFVIVHAGFAIEKLDDESARETLAMFDELRTADDIQA
jgi:hydrogenase expression/formation protein HypC